ncbi:MAG: DUF4386 domain-containing protein [Ginsengibacter sp.]
MENEIVSRKNTARLAGLLYLIWIITGLFAMFYIPSRIKMRSDAVSAARNILSNEFLFRMGIVNDLISSIIWVFMVLLLSRLFKEVNERHAKLLVALVIVQVPIVFFVETCNIASLMIFKGEILKTFELSQRQDLAMLFLKINDYVALTLEAYWGLWLLPLGLLVYKSRFLPRFLGIWLLINGFVFLVLSFTSLLLPQYKDMVFKIAFPAMLGEVAFMLWLLIMGAKNNIPTTTNAHI